MADDTVSKGQRNERALRHPETNYGNEKANHQAEVLYGNPGGSPGDAGNIDSSLGAAFTPVEGAARGNRDHRGAREIADVRAALGKEMLNLGFSKNAANELSALLGEYHGRPRDDEEMKNNLDRALEELSGEWGADFHARLEGAEGVIRSLTKGNPKLLDFLHATGLSRDARFLRLAGEVARHRAAMPAEKKGQSKAAAGQRSPNSRMADALYGRKG
jgi:hypothetical protein